MIIQTFFPLPLLAMVETVMDCGECTVENIDKGEGRKEEIRGGALG